MWVCPNSASACNFIFIYLYYNTLQEATRVDAEEVTVLLSKPPEHYLIHPRQNAGKIVMKTADVSAREVPFNCKRTENLTSGEWYYFEVLNKDDTSENYEFLRLNNIGQREWTAHHLFILFTGKL